MAIIDLKPKNIVQIIRLKLVGRKAEDDKYENESGKLVFKIVRDGRGDEDPTGNKEQT